MLLKNLIKLPSKKITPIDIKGLALDSRKIKKGYLFFALKGDNYNEEKFIKEAEKNGAAAIISSKKIKTKNCNIPLIKVSKIREELGNICKKFYKHKPKNIIAVTGTNGKTSVADFFHQILSMNNVPVASIGTLGIKKKNKFKKLNLTSPDIISLHKELADLKKSNIDNVIIETSSHGLIQGRINEINFKAGIFTNLSHDHLDYHKSLKDYLKAKMILFSKLLKKNSYIISDKQLKEFSILKKISNKRKLKLKTIDQFILNEKNLPKKIIGSFQKKNLLMSCLAAQLCGISKKKIFYTIKKINNVKGRLQFIKKLPNQAKIYIDYAHTPHALEVVLESLLDNYKNNLTLVFGCGGERDKKKRPMMAKIAKKYCNKIYITDDNPRNENAKKIRKEIIKYLKNDYLEIGNRSKAIHHAIKNSSYNEIILIAGKGHENYQNYGRKILNISDEKIIKKIFLENFKFKKTLNEYTWNSDILKKILNTKKKYEFRGVSINSKTLKKGNLFIAIKGKNKNGNDFIPQAIKRGAKFCVTSKNSKGKKLIKYDDNFQFLNKLAKFKREKSKAKIIAVTGSSGKTTVKNLLGNLLRLYDSTYYSPNSYNNHYGVPLSLSNLEFHHKYGVFEIGMSKKGEIHKLSKIVRPDIAIITNISEAHIENFKNIKEIAKAKGEIINNITENGLLILNRDDKFFNYFSRLAIKKRIKIISYGLSKKADVYLFKKLNFKKSTSYTIKIFNRTFKINDNNLNIFSILSSLCLAHYLNLNLKKTIKFLDNVSPFNGRGQHHVINRFHTKFNLIDESYNANPSSVKNAILNFSKKILKPSKKYLLLGDMLELGSKSVHYHENLSKLINNSDINKIFVIGDKILHTYSKIKKIKQGNILQHLEDFDDIFSKLIKKNDYLMIKGSNATGLNKLSYNIIKGAKNAV